MTSHVGNDPDNLLFSSKPHDWLSKTLPQGWKHQGCSLQLAWHLWARACAALSCTQLHSQSLSKWIGYNRIRYITRMYYCVLWTPDILGISEFSFMVKLLAVFQPEKVSRDTQWILAALSESGTIRSTLVVRVTANWISLLPPNMKYLATRNKGPQVLRPCMTG